MMGHGPMMHGFGLRRLSRSAGRSPSRGWPVAVVCDRPAGERPGILASVPAVDGSHGVHHSGRFGLGGAPRDGSPRLAVGGRRTARQRCERPSDAGDRHDRDAAGLARLQRHAGAPAQSDRKSYALAGGHLARPAHAADAAASAGRNVENASEREKMLATIAEMDAMIGTTLHLPVTRPRRSYDGRPTLPHSFRASSTTWPIPVYRYLEPADLFPGMPAGCAQARAAQPDRKRGQVRKKRMSRSSRRRRRSKSLSMTKVRVSRNKSFRGYSNRSIASKNREARKPAELGWDWQSPFRPRRLTAVK